MRHRSSHRAILVLESPWELDLFDSNRSSVIPFVEGIAKYAGDTEVYHANFYDKSSFNKALDCLCKRQFENTIVYIAAHGYKRKVGNVPIDHLMFQVGEKSREFNISGLMFGACYVGGNTITMEVFLEGTKLRWCAGYASTARWLEGTLIDCSIIANMSCLDDGDYSDRAYMIEQLADSMRVFSDRSIIGEDYGGNPVQLGDSIRFVLQPAGRGHRARDVTREVFDLYVENRFDEAI